MKIRINDAFLFHSSNGMDYKLRIVNINSYREPSEKYACEVCDGNGNYTDDVMFIGDDFFKTNKDKIERVKE